MALARVHRGLRGPSIDDAVVEPDAADVLESFDAQVRYYEVVAEVAGSITAGFEPEE